MSPLDVLLNTAKKSFRIDLPTLLYLSLLSLAIITFSGRLWQACFCLRAYRGNINGDCAIIQCAGLKQTQMRRNFIQLDWYHIAANIGKSVSGDYFNLLSGRKQDPFCCFSSAH